MRILIYSVVNPISRSG
jgi:hypothetical protein